MIEDDLLQEVDDQNKVHVEEGPMVASEVLSKIGHAKIDLK